MVLASKSTLLSYIKKDSGPKIKVCRKGHTYRPPFADVTGRMGCPVCKYIWNNSFTGRYYKYKHTLKKRIKEKSARLERMEREQEKSYRNGGTYNQESYHDAD